MSKRNFFEINPIEDPNKYWIFKELQSKQAVIIEDVSKKDWWEGVSRSIGIEAKEVMLDGERVVMSPTTNRYADQSFVVKRHNINLEEIKKGAISRFIPKRIDGK